MPNQVSLMPGVFVARPEGIEPPTHSLEVRCSNAFLCHLIKTLHASACAIDLLVVAT
jgi:hypothetical protein